MRNKPNQPQMTSNDCGIALIVCLLAGLVVGILIGLSIPTIIPTSDVESDNTETTYQPHVVELEGYKVDIVEYTDAETGVEYLIAIGPIGLAMYPKV